MATKNPKPNKYLIKRVNCRRDIKSSVFAIIGEITGKVLSKYNILRVKKAPQKGIVLIDVLFVKKNNTCGGKKETLGLFQGY